MTTYTQRLEPSTRYSILTQLDNLGWIIDEKNPDCNVTQERAKTNEQKKKLHGKPPDFVLYEQRTNNPIAIIEAKRPGKTLKGVLDEVEEKYAKPLEAPLIFVYNDTFIETRYLSNGRTLKIDGEDVRQFVDHYTALRFINEGPEILSAPKNLQYSREQLIKIFKKTSNLLREAGLSAGLERFGTFSDILFLKIMDEICELKLHANQSPPIPEYIRWCSFKDKNPFELHKYIKDVVWEEMGKKYGEIFSETFKINDPQILKDIVTELSKLNLTSSDTDVKGDAFEYFLKNAYQGINIKDLGEYFTPRNIVRIMVSMVNPQIGEKIYDPFCGTGGFLIECFKYLQIRTKSSSEVQEILSNKTIYGSEISPTARMAKMNMILFGDGHNNIIRSDSLKNPRNDKYDIVITNIPYSQKTRHGNLYSIPSTNGDAICPLHCFQSLNDGGRAAILVKENFLTFGGAIGQVRKYIIENAKNFSVISLPRKLFTPYTPTKTNIIYFEKKGKRNITFFYIVKNVGHTLTLRKKSIRQNDLPITLESFKSEEKSKTIESYIVDNKKIKENNYSLWAYDYFEIYPKSSFEMDYLGNYIEEITNKINLSDYPDKDFMILGVSNKFGIYENETISGVEAEVENIKKKYKEVKTGYLVYNPYRMNVGSIGMVTLEYDGGYESEDYVVFRSINKKIPPEYILKLLKSKQYIQVIESYDTKHGGVRAALTYEMLCRIKIPILSEKELTQFIKEQKKANTIKKEFEKNDKKLSLLINEYSDESRMIKNNFTTVKYKKIFE